LVPLDVETAELAKNRRAHATPPLANNRRWYILKFRESEIRDDVNGTFEMMFGESRRSQSSNGNNSQYDEKREEEEDGSLQ
jgi:hypothetical protein